VVAVRVVQLGGAVSMHEEVEVAVVLNQLVSAARAVTV
jgi:hypothetical protein